MGLRQGLALSNHPRGAMSRRGPVQSGVPSPSTGARTVPVRSSHNRMGGSEFIEHPYGTPCVATGGRSRYGGDCLQCPPAVGREPPHAPTGRWLSRTGARTVPVRSSHNRMGGSELIEHPCSTPRAATGGRSRYGGACLQCPPDFRIGCLPRSPTRSSETRAFSVSGFARQRRMKEWNNRAPLP